MVDKNNNGKGPKTNERKANLQTSLTKPEVSDLIAERLRSFYDDVSKLPVPDRFLELLKKLEASGQDERKK